jgi:glycerol-3-phosphate O-acyltransferase
MSKSGLGQMYRRLSSKLLDLVVTPHVLGEVPSESTDQQTSEHPAQKKSSAMYYKITLAAML